MTDLAARGMGLAGDRAPAALRIGDVLSGASRIVAARWLAFGAMIAPGPALFAAASWPPEVAQMRPSSHLDASPFAYSLEIQSAPSLALLALALVCSALAPAAVAFGAAKAAGGRQVPVGRCLGVALRRAPAILALTIVIGVGAMLGLVLLVVPGLLALCVTAVAIPACVVEGLGPIRSLTRSAFLTRGDRWRVFGLLVELYGSAWVVETLVVEATTHFAGDRVAAIVSLPLQIAIGAFTAVATAVLYARLRVAREGVALEQVATVFD
jgi:hypothetical protein